MTFGGDNSGDGPANYEYNDYFTTGSFGRIETPDVQIVQDSQLVVSASLQLPVFASNSGIVSSSAGQMWFNSTTRKLNFTMDVNSWSATGNLNTARSYMGMAGTQNAAIGVGGDIPSPATITDATELYDGSAWSFSESHDINTNRLVYAQVVGTQNSALAIGGNSEDGNTYFNETEAFNGSTWTEVNDTNLTRRLSMASGTQNAAFIAAGITDTPSVALTQVTEEWNGTNWTSVGNTVATKVFGSSGGTQNAGIIFGGSVDGGVGNAHGTTETYDGTTWTERNDMNVSRQAVGGSGTQNAAVVFGGQNPSSNTHASTEEWNGTSWSVVNALPTAQRSADGAGSQAAAITAGGSTHTTVDTAYELSLIHI